ncbi:hypothetical protein [Streptosporangium sp. NPDC000396]|uniref:hypothetical protein n=1 Tax=Streptosporangium sp. NPDC000396 TaxID=3366185 RepID=UPI0036C03C13
MKSATASPIKFKATAKLSALLVSGVVSCAAVIGGYSAATAGGTTWDSPSLIAAGTTWDSATATADGTTWD